MTGGNSERLIVPYFLSDTGGKKKITSDKKSTLFIGSDWIAKNPDSNTKQDRRRRKYGSSGHGTAEEARIRFSVDPSPRIIHFWDILKRGVDGGSRATSPTR